MSSPSTSESGAPAPIPFVRSFNRKPIIRKISPLKGSSDYAIWASKIEELLLQLELAGHIDDDYIAAHNKDAIWDHDDRNALIAIRSHVGEGAYIYVVSCKTAIDAWNRLKEIFKAHGMLASLYQRQKLNNIRMTEGDNLGHHIRKLRTEFKTMQRISGDVSRWDDEEWIILLIRSLPASWAPVIQTLPVEYERGSTPAITAKNQKKMVRAVTERLFAAEARSNSTGARNYSGASSRFSARSDYRRRRY